MIAVAAESLLRRISQHGGEGFGDAEQENSGTLERDLKFRHAQPPHAGVLCAASSATTRLTSPSPATSESTLTHTIDRLDCALALVA